MNSHTTIDELTPAQTILFLGSGFSHEATNLRHSRLPVGDQLKKVLAEDLQIDPNLYDLKTISDEYVTSSQHNLYQTLYSLYTVNSLTSSQNEILSRDWLRIYTTNYDDSVEFHRQKTGQKLRSFNYNDEKPRRIPPGAVIHLHGVIRSTSENNVIDQLVLNEQSYARQHFERSVWYEEFIRDLKFCDRCYFVGYSLADYHITALLMQNPLLKEKIVFITRPPVDHIFQNRVSPFGRILECGVDGFAEMCRTLPARRKTADLGLLKMFKFLDPFKDKKTLAPPTAIEILNLVTFGTFNYQRCLSTLPRVEYVVPRDQAVNEAVDLLKAANCLLVHSRLGNGKSIFLHLLAYRLSELGFKCFICRENASFIEEEVETVTSSGRCVILFDSYNTALELIDQLPPPTSDLKYIVSVRSGIQDVRLHEIQEQLPKPLRRLDLNRMTEADAADFVTLLNRAGGRVSHFERIMSECRDFREVVLTLYQNTDIKERIRKSLQPLLTDANSKRVFITIHLLKWIGQDVDASFLRATTRVDAYAEINKFREIAADVFRLQDDEIASRSAVLSEHLIEDHFDSADMIACVYDVLIEAVKRKKNDRRYRTIAGRLMQVNNLKRLLRRSSDANIELVPLFERLRRDIDVNDEPLFWLQYCILMVDRGDLAEAEVFLETAYARADSTPGFKPYQIDTQALRLLLLLEAQDRSPRVARFEQIVEKLELVMQMVNEDSHRYFAIKVLDGIEPFIRNRLTDMTIDELNVMVFQMSRALDGLSRLTPEVRAQTGSDQVRDSILRAKEAILAP